MAFSTWPAPDCEKWLTLRVAPSDGQGHTAYPGDDLRADPSAGTNLKP